PISTFYGLTTLILTYFICIPLGIIKAIHHNRIVDHLSSIFIFIGYALPSYVIAIIVFFIFCAQLEWFPLGGFVSDEFDMLSLPEKVVDVAKHAAMPLLAYMIGSF